MNSDFMFVKILALQKTQGFLPKKSKSEHLKELAIG